MDQPASSSAGEPLAELLLDLPAPVVVFDDAGVVTFANRDLGDLLERPREALVGRPVVELLVTADDRPLAAGDLVESDHPPCGRGVELVALRPGGARVPVLAGVRRLAGRVALVLRDLTAHQRETAARRALDDRVHRLLDTVRVIPWEADVTTYQFTFVGMQAEAILGYPIAAWYEDKFWPSHIHPDDRDHALSTCSSSLKRETHYAFEYRMIAADGRVVWIHDIVVVSRVSDRPHILSGFMLDVTAQKQAELERARLLDEARRAVRLRDEFTHIAAHELRTPLTPLRLHLEQALRQVARLPASDDHRRHLDVALRQLGRLERLVESLLDVTRIRQGGLTLEPTRVDLGELAREVAASLSGLLERARCPLTIDASPDVVGQWDRLRIEQVLINLLTNAAKYGAGAPIEIGVHADGPRALLVVRDRGIGIAADDHERIFEWCERAVSPGSYGGLGLGLYITRQLIAAHGGTITITSEPGAGSTFTVELPLA
jgi:PAS domain S-box-containing protein